jgi:hypothetical protein
MKTIQNEAARLAFLLNLGIVSAKEVIAWADEAIVAGDRPSSALIDLSVSAPARIPNALRELGLGVDAWTTVKEAMPCVLREVEKKPELARVVAREFYHIAVSENYIVPKRYSFFIRSDDDFDLAESGVLVYGEVYKGFIEDIRGTLYEN